MNSDRLFVYGTLMRGFDHPMARLLAGHADFLSEATCCGRLVLVKHYPGLLLSDAASDIVHGELFHLRAPDELLRELDMYEACGEGFSEPTEYLRKLIDVTGSDGTTGKAWTYIYNWPVTDLPRIETGRFLGH
ncbi:gamma-glutamylcyclotransferase [Bradyrhizobium sp. 139]|uniref:gamma-glutamylcyclotransferase family protein n=1 Tax=Bradyrhizobium sp. 139 TaxID=2782616 RepID=UPI001FF838EA|nr:gamma-glutamylcyclotransferase family protein [Bradyrhizobium sp. 139]MCK1745900.1 gamma-glutamylcyclotransferase [Bradyrhizobium sp. 139]